VQLFYVLFVTFLLEKRLEGLKVLDLHMVVQGASKSLKVKGFTRRTQTLRGQHGLNEQMLNIDIRCKLLKHVQ